ncbi:MAG: BREX-1 system phosphatase PglZ type A [Atopobiaceae bacterium]|nr:BREX-1 system phosphatase PglZ type A [Atopobiaceae bacterium]
MESSDITTMLKERLCAPLQPCAVRRIVIWHDADGSFEAEFDRFSVFGLGFEEQLERPLEFVKADEGSTFALKRLIYREKPQADFLVYARYQKDLSPHALEDNWLADVELVAEHFQADYASMLVEELGAVDSAVDGIERFTSFFRAAGRKKKFVRLMPHAQTEGDVVLGVLGTLLNATGLSTSQIMKSYLVALLAEENPLAKLAKYGADGPFESYVQSRLGYAGDLQFADEIASHILLSALSCTLPDGALSGLEGRMSLPHGQFCLNVVDDWMHDEAFGDDFYDLCRRVERVCNLEQRFSQITSSDLAESDALPCLNERILVDLMGSLAQGADRVAEALSLAKRRKDLAWYSRVAPYFDALTAAAVAARFFREHAQGFHHATPADVWKAYTSDWYLMDTFYRHFCRACDACLHSTADVPMTIENALDELASWIERVYTNWFLAETNGCWVKACKEQWLDQGYAEGIDRQKHFYDERVVSGAGGAKRSLVIVSDALRYEVAVELAERLERDTKGTAELRSMQSVFPSITEFGMAALLPNHTLSYDWNTGVVSCDGRPTAGTKERELVLQARTPSSRAIQSKDLISTKRALRKQLVGDAGIVYVYHNKIDATGEDYATEHDVFAACDTTVDDLVALVKIAVNDLNISRVVITADHGFIYTREALEERDKVSKADIGAEPVRLGRRYAILNVANVDDHLFIRMNMDSMQGGTYVGLSPRECVRIKKAGPGESYVHGGASMQEMCVPVIQFRNRRGGSKGFVDQQKATLRLLSTGRRVNAMIFRVELFQPEAVGGKVLPAEYELVMTDASGNEVSNVIKAHADMVDADDTARVTRSKFSLKAGRQYGAKETYYLVCRERTTKQMVWKEEYTIDIAFAPTDDFGF